MSRRASPWLILQDSLGGAWARPPSHRTVTYFPFLSVGKIFVVLSECVLPVTTNVCLSLSYEPDAHVLVESVGKHNGEETLVSGFNF